MLYLNGTVWDKMLDTKLFQIVTVDGFTFMCDSPPH